MNEPTRKSLLELKKTELLNLVGGMVGTAWKMQTDEDKERLTAYEAQLRRDINNLQPSKR